MSHGPRRAGTRHAGAHDVQWLRGAHPRRERRPEQQRCGLVAERLAGTEQRLVGLAGLDDRLDVESERTNAGERMLHATCAQSGPRRLELGMVARADRRAARDRVLRSSGHAPSVTISAVRCSSSPHNDASGRSWRPRAGVTRQDRPLAETTGDEEGRAERGWGGCRGPAASVARHG